MSLTTLPANIVISDTFTVLGLCGATCLYGMLVMLTLMVGASPTAHTVARRTCHILIVMSSCSIALLVAGELDPARARKLKPAAMTANCLLQATSQLCLLVRAYGALAARMRRLGRSSRSSMTARYVRFIVATCLALIATGLAVGGVTAIWLAAQIRLPTGGINDASMKTLRRKGRWVSGSYLVLSVVVAIAASASLVFSSWTLWKVKSKSNAVGLDRSCWRWRSWLTAAFRNGVCAAGMQLAAVLFFFMASQDTNARPAYPLFVDILPLLYALSVTVGCVPPPRCESANAAPSPEAGKAPGVCVKHPPLRVVVHQPALDVKPAPVILSPPIQPLPNHLAARRHSQPASFKPRPRSAPSPSSSPVGVESDVGHKIAELPPWSPFTTPTASPKPAFPAVFAPFSPTENNVALTVPIAAPTANGGLSPRPRRATTFSYQDLERRDHPYKKSVRNPVLECELIDDDVNYGWARYPEEKALVEPEFCSSPYTPHCSLPRKCPPQHDGRVEWRGLPTLGNCYNDVDNVRREPCSIGSNTLRRPSSPGFYTAAAMEEVKRLFPLWTNSSQSTTTWSPKSPASSDNTSLPCTPSMNSVEEEVVVWGRLTKRGGVGRCHLTGPDGDETSGKLLHQTETDVLQSKLEDFSDQVADESVLTTDPCT